MKKSPYTLTWIIAAALVAIGISLIIGMQQSVWFDEAYSVLVAQHDPAKIVQLVSVDIHPPGYYLLLHFWGDTFGWEDLPLRLLSVLALGGSIVMAGILTRRLFGDKAAVAAVTVAALSPLLLRYGFEMRMYSIASLIGVSATYVMVSARAAGKKYAVWLWAAYALLVITGVMISYHLTLLWAAHAAWLAYSDRGKLKYFWKLPWVRAYAAAVVPFLLWLPTFIAQLGGNALASIGQPMNLEQILGVFSFNIFYVPLWQVDIFQTILLLAVITIGTVAFMRAYKHKQTRAQLLLLAAYIAVPVMLFMVASILRPLYVERYLSHVAIGGAMLAGVLVTVLTKPYKPLQRTIIYVLGVGILIIGVYNLAHVGNYNYQRMQKPDVAASASTIDCVGATVVAADPYVATELSYYLPTTCDMRFYSEWNKMGGGYAPFSESPLRLSTTKIPLLTSRLYYVYYANPTLELVPEYHQVNITTNNGLTVAEYEAN